MRSEMVVMIYVKINKLVLLINSKWFWNMKT